MIKTLEEYIDYYRKYDKTIDQINKPNQKLSLNVLKNKYERWLKKEKTKELKKEFKFKKGSYNDEHWIEIKTKAFEKNPNAEYFFKCLTIEEKEFIRKNMIGELAILDPAHIMGKSNDLLYYNLKNIIIMPRYFHSLIDHYINPFTLKNMNDNEHEKLWRRFVDNNIWEYLLKLKKGIKQ